MSVCEKDPPVPADVSEYAEKQTTTRLDGSLDNTGGPPRTPTQTCATATVTLCKDVDTNLRLQKAAKILLKNQKPSTARAPDVATTRLDPQVEEAKKVLEKELGKCIELPESNTFASSLYHHLAPDEEIEHFLAGTDVYNSAEHRWALPKSHEGLKEERMYKPLVKLLNAIFQWFWHETNLRKAVDTHSTQLPHKEFADTNNYSRPDITIKAKGPSFQLPQDKTIGYSNMATCFEVKVTNQGWSVVKELLQLAGYARQIFIQQPNRRFVRALIITEENFRLFHFDRSGVQYTQTINIHEEAHTFVRLVLGLSSLVESDLGLDTSIKWEIQDGRKIGGTLTTRNGNNAEVEYRLAEVDPVSSSYKIRDRGVICWRVIDPKSGDIMLVKEIWRAEDRLSEDFYLEMAKGVPGVVQMISFEYNRGDTKQFRGFDGPPPSDFRNRVAVRIVLDTEGKSIEHFKSPKELLCALRDAIDGHRELSLKNALHGRITLANVVLGKPDAPPGYRGLLMGLDMAVLNKMDASNLSAEPMAITEIYQSIAEIRRVHGIHQNPLAHSYLDDLESFVYVLTRIMYGYDQTLLCQLTGQILTDNFSCSMLIAVAIVQDLFQLILHSYKLHQLMLT
ncbi:hypothetical protein EST38_g4778 [Candolleomyces aberdarensis]|uniref:Fungal-type protein kinase domain-containing protein n=1 Tax=Candolleomyces aberdarensis TaxID=2316362 RepID=A0A4Q2DM47_9AGAR|nr:hypothetical protein EST38_g4778 [Candolleomyces aberdarensis]